MKIIVERIEGKYAMLEMESGYLIDAPLTILPAGVKEGDVVEILINKEETLRRKERLQKLAEELWE